MSNLTNKERQSARQYRREFLPSILFYMFWVFMVPEILDYTGDGWWTIPVTLTQVIPIVFVMRAVLRFVERSDEMMQHIYLKASAATLVILMFFIFSYGFLEIRGYQHIPLFMIGTGIIPTYFLIVCYYKRVL